MKAKDLYSPIVEKAKAAHLALPVHTFYSQWDTASQWHPSIFTDPSDNRTYLSCEHFMMSQKAMLFNCSSVLAQLDQLRNTLLFKSFSTNGITPQVLLSKKLSKDYATDKAMETFLGKAMNGEVSFQNLWSSIQWKIKALGKKVSGFVDATWNDVRETIVFVGNYLKYSQNAAMKEYLMSTKGMIFVEAAKNDQIWGVGLPKGASELRFPHLWNGLNLLGKVHTNLRAYFQEELGL